MVAVSTDVARGSPFVFAPFEPATESSFSEWYGATKADVALVDAALSSARFPWITPSARLNVATPSQRYEPERRVEPGSQALQMPETNFRLLVDGGYIDNSGVDIATFIASEIKSANDPAESNLEHDSKIGHENGKSCHLIFESSFASVGDNEPVRPSLWKGCDIHVFLSFLVIAGASEGMVTGGRFIPGHFYEAPTVHSRFLFDPVLALNSSRIAKGQTAIGKLDIERCESGSCLGIYTVNNGYFVSSLPINEFKLPLGWVLREKALKLVSRSTAGIEMDPQYMSQVKTTLEAEASANGDRVGRNSERLDPNTNNDRQLSWAKENSCSLSMLYSIFDLTLTSDDRVELSCRASEHNEPEDDEPEDAEPEDNE